MIMKQIYDHLFPSHHRKIVPSPSFKAITEQICHIISQQSIKCFSHMVNLCILLLLQFLSFGHSYCMIFDLNYLIVLVSSASYLVLAKSPSNLDSELSDNK